MGQLIDLFLENPLFIIILIGGIFSFLRGKSEKPEDENKPSTTNQRPQRAESTLERTPRPARTRSSENQVQVPVSSKSVEEIREEQMARFTTKRESHEDDRGKDIPRIADSIGKEVVREKDFNHNKQAFKNDFNKSLTRKGLINSVIMAEVLGAPRARNSYQTVITKRRSN